MSERLKVAWPVLVVAWKSEGSRLPAVPGSEAKAEDWAAVGDLIVWEDGHGFCGGWTFDPVTQVITCACGASLFEVGDPVTGVAS